MIDASVARAARGPGATVSPSPECTQFLRDVLDVCHRVVMSDEIKNEWTKHRSPFANEWLTIMIRRIKRKPVDSASPSLEERIAGAILESEQLRTSFSVPRNLKTVHGVLGSVQLAHLFKDLHLVEAGLSTDRIVASLDDRAKRGFSRLSASIQEFRDLIWVNPATDVDLSDWLESGADFDDSLTLERVQQAPS